MSITMTKGIFYYPNPIYFCNVKAFSEAQRSKMFLKLTNISRSNLNNEVI
jgi:hypothetical protein